MVWEQRGVAVNLDRAFLVITPRAAWRQTSEVNLATTIARRLRRLQLTLSTNTRDRRWTPLGSSYRHDPNERARRWVGARGGLERGGVVANSQAEGLRRRHAGRRHGEHAERRVALRREHGDVERRRRGCRHRGHRTAWVQVQRLSGRREER